MVKIREASFGDFEDISILRNRYGMGTRNYKEWEHLWKNNPVTKGKNEPLPIGWVLENDQKRIVGYLGNLPVAYEFKGEKIIAVVAISWVVDEAYRNYSILLITNCFLAQDNARLFLNTTADYTTGKVLSALKAQRVPVNSYDTVAFWIVNYRKFISSVFLKKRFPLRSIISYPVSFGMWCIDKISLKNRYLNRCHSDIQCCSAFDERFDVFWHALKERYYDRLLCARDSLALNWHFARAIVKKQIWIFLAEDKSRITDYAIFLRQDNPEIGLKRVVLVDFQTTRENSDSLIEMISSGISRCRREGIHMLDIVGFDSQKRDAIKKYFPHERKLSTFPFFYKTKDQRLMRELQDTKVWDPCLFDGDGSL